MSLIRFAGKTSSSATGGSSHGWADSPASPAPSDTEAEGAAEDAISLCAGLVEEGGRHTPREEERAPGAPSDVTEAGGKERGGITVDRVFREAKVVGGNGAVRSTDGETAAEEEEEDASGATSRATVSSHTGREGMLASSGVRSSALPDGIGKGRPAGFSCESVWVLVSLLWLMGTTGSSPLARGMVGVGAVGVRTKKGILLEVSEKREEEFHEGRQRVDFTGSEGTDGRAKS